MKSKVFVYPVFVLMASLALQAQSQPGKVAVINIQAAIVNTKDGQKAATDLQAKAAPKQKEIEQRQNDINNLQDQLTKGQNTLSEATKNELYRNIEQKKKTLDRDVQDASSEMDEAQQKVLQTLGQKMLAVIERYARDNGFTMVLDVSSPQSPVLYASPTVDITKEIIDLYDKNAPAMSSPAPTAPKSSATPALSNPTPAKQPGTAAPPTKPPAAPPKPPTPKP